MSISRRDFMNVFGVSLASLLLSRCKWSDLVGGSNKTPVPTQTPTISCYAPVAPTFTPSSLSDALPARERLRLSWLSFNELAKRTVAESNQEPGETDLFRQELSTYHRSALNELTAAGEISPTVADLVQEAFDAAAYHVWRSSVPITCYMTMGPIYAPESAAVLIQQAEILNQIAGQGNLDQETLARARSALEHDLAFYALSEADLQALYKRLSENGQTYPPFEELELLPSADARTAAEFILELVMQN
jgi:hypothetical protein